MNSVQKTLQCQIPYKLDKRDPSICEWLYTGGKKFDEPFFSDSISVCRQLKENSSCYKSISQLDMLDTWAGEFVDIPDPAAIIFHVSRCGSTLFSQLLGLEVKHMVLSEVPFFDELLRLPFKQQSCTSREVSNLLKASIKIYGNSRREVPTQVFIKSDSWHLFFYQQLREMFPRTAFILLYRNPWEVIQSQQRRRGMQSVPGVLEPALFGFKEGQPVETNLDKYMAEVLHSYFAIMLAIAGENAHVLLVNYSEGAIEISNKMFSYLNIEMTATIQRAIDERVKYHAKYPRQIFCEENEKALPPGYLAPVMDLYNELDKVRLFRS